MSLNAYIGIDLGTSGCRAYAIDDNADIIASSRQQFDSSHNQTEQNPAAHWSIVLQTLTELLSQCQKYTVESIAIDATSGSILITDSVGKPLSPILMYNDNRAIDQSKQIAMIAPAESGAYGASSGLAKLLYLQHHTPVSEQHHLLHQVDWINFNLGVPLGITDENNALKSGYDPITRHWPSWVNDLVSPSVLPKVVVPGTVIGGLSKQLCKQFKLSNQPALVAGTTDSIAALLATGAQKIGDAVTSLGSTLVVKVISDKAIFLPEYGVYSHRIGDQWLVGGASNTGGAVLQHYFNNRELQTLSKQINSKKVVPTYYPLLSKGERFPINDPNLLPQLAPRPASDVDFLHAILNGMAMIEQLAYQVLEQAGAPPIKSVRTVGGGAINTVWQTIRQQKIPVSFITPKQTEAAYGAALLAKG